MRRTGLMPSRPLRVATGRRITVSGPLQQNGVTAAKSLTVDIQQPRGARAARGVLRVVTATGDTARALSFGVIQTGDDWATVSGIMRMKGQDRAFSAIFDGKHPLQRGTSPLVVLHLQGLPTVTGTVSGATAMRLQ
jgi:hypothetical protein